MSYLEEIIRRFDAEKAEITGKLFDQINENKKLREQLVSAKAALGKIAAERARFDGDAWFLRDIARAALIDEMGNSK